MNWNNIFTSWNLFVGFGFLIISITSEGVVSTLVPFVVALFFFSVWANWHYEKMEAQKK